MVNFNTREMKIAFSKVNPDIEVQPLPDDSVTSLKLAIEWALEKGICQTCIVAFDGYYLTKEHYQSITTYLERFGPEFLTKLSDSMTIRAGACVLTIKINGSSEMHAKAAKAAPNAAKAVFTEVTNSVDTSTPKKRNTRARATAKPPSGKKKGVTITTPSKSKKRKTAGASEPTAKVEVAEYSDEEEFGALTQECMGLF